MSRVVESLENETKKSITKKPKKKDEGGFSPDYLEWIINRPQADRILEHLKLLNQYIEDRNSLRTPITRFQTLINKFLEQTKKTVEIASNGQLTIHVIGNSDDNRPISALSSGERQLLVMLAHLSLNQNLAGSGVFIVDEPELSLHIDWQEKFVDAIREANPNVQLILATHSPAIILDNIEACRTLNELQHD